MSDMTSAPPQLDSIQRRVLGVLVEKARTTPDAYPMTLNALTTGCNQKSNRAPKMNLDPDDVLIALDELRDRNAVIELPGTGRAIKYRHRLYDWLEVDATEGAILAELLLRGAQTSGELRGRASRMATIPDIGTLRPIVDRLIERRLVVALTPPGRGQIVTHGLYLDREWAKVRQSAEGRAGERTEQPASTAPSGPPLSADAVAQLQAELERLAQAVTDLQDRVRQLEDRNA